MPEQDKQDAGAARRHWINYLERNQSIIVQVIPASDWRGWEGRKEVLGLSQSTLAQAQNSLPECAGSGPNGALGQA